MTMIEAVARAIYDLMPHDGLLHGRFVKPEWVEGGNSIRQNDARRMARAVLTALLTPDEGMARMGSKAIYDMGGHDHPDCARYIFEAMIQSALSEKT